MKKNSASAIFLAVLFFSAAVKNGNAQTTFTAPVVTSFTGTTTSYQSISHHPAFVPAGSTVGATETYSFGTQNKQLTSFTVGGTVYQKSAGNIPDQVIFRRNSVGGQNVYPGTTLNPGQQAVPWGDRQNFYIEGTFLAGTYNLVGSYPGTYNSATNLEEHIAFQNGYANLGTDNTFVNQEVASSGGAYFNNGGDANATANNVERIDVIWSSGILVTATNLANSGVIIGNRGQNDDAIKVSAIKGLTGGSNTGGGSNYLYDNVLEFNNAWTQKGVNGGALSGSYAPTTILAGMPSVAMRRTDTDGLVNGTVSGGAFANIINGQIPPQDVKAMFLTFADLGLVAGDTFYGYSIIPADALVGGSSTSVNSFLNSAIYPTTSTNSKNGADISAISGYFINSTVLPVNLVSFTGRVMEESAIVLNWSTSSETNNDHFVLERSKDMENFEALAAIKSKAGPESSGNISYSYVDDKPHSGTSYYRLKQVDFDGKSTIYRAINLVLRKDGYGIFPNPLTGSQFILKLDEPKTAQIILYNSNGSVMPIKQLNSTSGSLRLEIAAFYPAGIYILNVRERGQVRTYKIVKP